MATRNAKARKYYLSDAAIALLERESERTTYPMSTVLDILIKAHLGAPGPAAHVPDPVTEPPLPFTPGPDLAISLQPAKGFTLDGI